MVKTYIKSKKYRKGNNTKVKRHKSLNRTAPTTLKDRRSARVKLSKQFNRTRKLRGGELIVSETDIKNNHLCGEKTGKESVGQEVYTGVDTPLQIDESTLETFFANYKKSDDKWFKYVIFNNDDTIYIYIINGREINKHSVIVLHGILEVSSPTEYDELRKAYNTLLELKAIHGISDPTSIETHESVIRLNELVARDIPCMPVIAAGSGTINDDMSICLNTKSGHYKPTLDNLATAKDVFESITKLPVHIQRKADRELLIEKYGDRVKDFSGMCL